MSRQRNKPSNTTNNQSNKEIWKENEKSLENKDIKDCALNDREFKIAVLKELNEIQKNSKRQSHELKNRINKLNEYLIKKIEILQKNQTEMLELKNSIYAMKNEQESLGNEDQMEGKNSNIGDRNLEMTHVEEERGLRGKKRWKSSTRTIWHH